MANIRAVSRGKKNSCTARKPINTVFCQSPVVCSIPGHCSVLPHYSFKLVVRMFRASLRSVSDPLRDNVCFSCLARRFAAPTNLRRFHRVPALRAQFSSHNGGSSAEETLAAPTMARREQDSSGKVCDSRSCGSCMIRQRGGTDKTLIQKIPERVEQANDEFVDESLPDTVPSDAAQLQHQQMAARRARRTARQRDKRRAKENEKPDEGETKSGPASTGKRKAAIQKVNQILDEKTLPKKGPRGPKGKLSHVANFINEKHTGVVDSETHTLKGKLCSQYCRLEFHLTSSSPGCSHGPGAWPVIRARSSVVQVRSPFTPVLATLI